MSNQIGLRFKEIRKKKHLSLKQVSEGITSIARLSRWENGLTNDGMPIEIVEKLIKRLNISYDELLSKQYKYSISIMYQVRKLYKNNDIDGLKSLTDQLLSQYRNGKIEILPSAVAANFYLDLTGKSRDSVMTKTELLELSKYCRYLKVWTIDETIIFSNVQLLLEPDLVYMLSRELISTMHEKGFYTNYAIISLLNAAFVLIKSKKVEYARKIICILNSLDDIVDYKYNLEFLNDIIFFIDHHDSSRLDSLFLELESLTKYKQLKSDYKFAFSQVKQIYNLE
ncbi:Rgg/GadR/MutR family transcriptional activator [Lactobacillus colini]|uniref:Rgg/GadR/MutR family transcriptional activator n=1 Tax=Lactobacillus colini TaxID=1819254 RepID=A0ABS4MGA2_9LACO|nr:Rgg/GadR/MutR family transcriptional regulator [Lactobacillus colini]MBP2058720.1 Rgg/GadR/MutR family transcriptional activator [Lactobacillus colini]